MAFLFYLDCLYILGLTLFLLQHLDVSLFVSGSAVDFMHN